MIKLKDLLKEGSGFFKIDPGPKRWFKPYGDKYTEYEKSTNPSLKEAIKIGNKINKARAKAHFKQGENIAVVDKNTGDAIRITDLRQLDAFDSKTHDFAYIIESVNEALPKFKSPAEGLKWVWSKRDEAMDMEQELKDISAEIQQLYGEMEQDAEPGGGPIADRYGRELEALENKHKDLRAEYDHVMTEIDEFDQHYIGF